MLSKENITIGLQLIILLIVILNYATIQYLDTRTSIMLRKIIEAKWLLESDTVQQQQRPEPPKEKKKQVYTSLFDAIGDYEDNRHKRK